jgi:hypothetical protein
MKDLLLDTGRIGGSDKGVFSRAKVKSADPDSLPKRLPSSRHRCGGKQLGDRLNPLRRFLAANCGRPWAKVYAEICAFADSRTVRGYHLRTHVWSLVVLDNLGIGQRRYGPFFVDRDGTLQEARKQTEAERAAEYAYWRKRHKWKEPPAKRANPRIAVDADHWFEKIEGFWFSFETKHYTFKNSYEDLVEENGEIKIVRIPLPEYTKNVTSKRQVNGKVQKELDKQHEKRKVVA